MEAAGARARRKVNLSAGFSQLDWLRLAQAQGRRGAGGAAPRALSLDEVRLHNALDRDCWVVVRGRVLDVTKYGPYHPGGLAVLAPYAGDDATSAFEEVHPWVSLAMLDRFVVGWVEGDEAAAGEVRRLTGAGAAPPGGSPSGGAKSGKRTSLLSMMAGATLGLGASSGAAAEAVAEPRWTRARLIARSDAAVGRSCVLVRLSLGPELPAAAAALLRQAGVSLRLRMRTDKGAWVERFFTPLLWPLDGATRAAGEPSSCAALLRLPERLGNNEVDLLVKHYADGQLSKALAQGALGLDLEAEVRRGLFSLAVGAGGSLRVQHFGAAGLRKAAGEGVAHVCLIAAGTALMPMLQIRDWLVREAAQGRLAKPPALSMLLCNRSEAEAPLKALVDSLPGLSGACPVSRVTHHLSSARGRIGGAALAEHLRGIYAGAAGAESAASPAIRFFLSGSYEFAQLVVQELTKQGWPASAIVKLD